ncbi:MAG: DUF420 domain-containing protein [Nitrospinota bacterium]|nr:DUF420 domain-containing protein [Nitrospinota bacterium]
MKELLAKPGIFVESGTIGADLSYFLAIVFTLLFLLSWRLAKKGEGTQHHNLIFVSMASMVAYFVTYYWFRQLGVLVLQGKEGFGGSEKIYNNVFMPILTTHLVLVTLGLIMAFYMTIEGFRASQKVDGVYSLTDGELKMRPQTFRTTMLVVLALWATNQIVLSFVRQASWQTSLAWAIIFTVIALVVSIEKLIERWMPDGARRHRLLGRGTMVIFLLLLITSTLTYLMLYVIYPAKPI